MSLFHKYNCQSLSFISFILQFIIRIFTIAAELVNICTFYYKVNLLLPPSLEECRVATQVTNDDFMNLMNPNKPKTRAMKCFITCVAEKLGQVVNLNKKFLHKKILINNNQKDSK